MSISRITTWVDGQVLTAAALNNEFDNVLNNATALISPLTGTLNANLNQISNLVLEKLSAVPATVTTGRLFYDTVLGQLRVGVSIPAGTPGQGNTTAYVIVGPIQTLSRVSGLEGSIISNIGSFAALGYQAALAGRGASVTITATSSFSINTQTPGPTFNGRDQAGAFASTDVHFYAAINSLGSTTIYGICSSNPPPTGPTAVLFWAYLGSAKYNVAASAVTQSWTVRGSRFYPKSTSATSLLTISNGTSERLAGSTSRVPAHATNVEIMVPYVVGTTVGGILAVANFNLDAETSPAGGYRIGFPAALNGGAINGYSYAVATVTLPNTGVIATKITNTNGDSSLGVDLLNYQVANGDN